MPATDKEGVHTTTTTPTGLASVGPDDNTPVLLLNEKAAARCLSISPRLLWSLEASGQIKAIRIHRAKRYAVSELQRFVDAQKKRGGDR